MGLSHILDQDDVSPSYEAKSFRESRLECLPNNLERNRVIFLYTENETETEIRDLFQERSYLIEECTLLYPEKTIRQVTEQIGRSHEYDIVEIREIAQQYRDNLRYIQKDYELKDPFLRMIKVISRKRQYLLLANKRFLDGLEIDDIPIIIELVKSSFCKILILLSNYDIFEEYKLKYKEFCFMKVSDIKGEPLVYISHHWGGEADDITEGLCNQLNKEDIFYAIDKKDAKFKINLMEFEVKIGNGYAIIPVIDELYLKSIDCMFELAQAAENKDFEGRTFPIVSFDIERNANGLKELIAYWEAEYAKFDQQAKALGPGSAQMCIIDMQRVSLILNRLGKIYNFLKRDITYSKSDILRNGYSGVIDAVRERLSKIAVQSMTAANKDANVNKSSVSDSSSSGDSSAQAMNSVNVQLGANSTIINNGSGTINIGNK